MAHPLPARAAAGWVILDSEVPREGDRSSLQREGPWAVFTQRWVTRDGNAGPVQRMAVNCLTGAYGAKEYAATDSDSGRRVPHVQSFEEIEHAERDEDRLLLHDNATSFGSAVMKFACTCPGGRGPDTPAEVELQSVYDRYVVGPMSKEEFHLGFVRLHSKEAALAAIAKLRAGVSFEAVFEEYASFFDAKTFPHGDLGVHLESEWPIEEARLYRQMKPGEFTQTPQRGIYGWDVNKMLSRRTIPAPPFGALQSRLKDYVARAHQCGWKL
jgi:parvulin-like peptidyl-prolyl isomerase